MKKSLILTTLAAALALATASVAHAQLTLHNFTNLAAPETLFYGDWSDTGDPFVGSTGHSPLFSQEATTFTLAGASNADTAFFEHTFLSSLNLSGNTQLNLKLKLLADNTADSVTVFLFDTSARSAFATFSTSSFNTSGFVERTLTFTTDAGFDIGSVGSFRLSGNDPFASGTLSVVLDNVGAVPVPEPATYGICGALLLGALALRRKLSDLRR